MTWKKFEELCLIYLQTKYTELVNIQFHLGGQSNSHESDIFVTQNGQILFYIEVKMANSQCGQFVVIPDHDKFIYSPKNMYPINTYAESILNYMNENFDNLRDVSTSGDPLHISSDLAFGWIKQHYTNKRVKFFITHDGVNFKIFPIDLLNLYFEVEPKYRIKKSGSSRPSHSNMTEVSSLVNDPGVVYNYDNGSVSIITSCGVIDQTGKILNGNKYSYLLKETSHNTYAVRRLSNTRNANVIFSIHLKDSNLPDHSHLLDEYLGLSGNART